MTGGPASSEGKGGYSLYLLAFIVALLMIVSMALGAAPEDEEGRWAVGSGDVLQYSILGHRNGAAVTGTAVANFAAVNITEGGSSTVGHFYTDLGSWTGRGAVSALSSPTSGACLGWERIETVYGAKAVTRYISYHGGNGTEAQTFIVTYAGVDSKVIYRINVSGPDFFLSLDLSTSTLDDPGRLDIKRAVDISPNFLSPTEGEFTSIIGAGISTVGYWHLPEGTHIDHTMESDGSLFYFVTEENIERMECGGILESDPAMSLLNGNGSHSAKLDGGLYILVTDAGAAAGDTREHFEIEMSP